MTQCSKNEMLEAESQHKLMLAAMDAQSIAAEIQELIDTNHMSYLEATIQWMEEKSIPEVLYAKYIPSTIVEYIKEEAIAENMLRPSVSVQNKSASLDFLFG